MEIALIWRKLLVKSQSILCRQIITLCSEATIDSFGSVLDFNSSLFYGYRTIALRDYFM